MLIAVHLQWSICWFACMPPCIYICTKVTIELAGQWWRDFKSRSCKRAMSFVMWRKLSCFASGLCMEALRKAALATLTCSFALCGSLIGSVSGALKGQTTETGLFRGAGIGLVAGALVSVEILESCLQGELLSKLSVFESLLNGKVFPEWVIPATLKAYQWQMNSVEATSTEGSDIFEVPCNDGLLPSKIRMLPEFTISREDNKHLCRKKISCAVCLQDFMYGESARRLPTCGHVFHIDCIDTWLLRHGSCPICRHDVLRAQLLT